MSTSTFVYDGDGTRGKKTEGGETVLYVNRYYQKNLTTGEETTHYYLGGRLVAMRQGTTLEYVHQDHLTGTSLVTESGGNQVGGIKYYPYGTTRSGSVPTDRKFTGQRLDAGTGLYYYNARYYDAEIGRFVSADTIVPDPSNPQTLNRYSYTRGNPLKYTDPTGNYVEFTGGFSYRSGRNRQRVEQAWEMLKWAATDMPKLAEMIQKAEESEALVRIGWDPRSEGTGSMVVGDERLGKQSMLIDTSLLDKDIRLVAKTMAHELYHVDEGRQVDSIWEEMEAYAFEYDVARKLCLPLRGTTLEELGELDALNTADLQTGARILEQLGAVYPWIPLQPVGVSDPVSELMGFGSYWAWYEVFGERAPW